MCVYAFIAANSTSEPCAEQPPPQGADGNDGTQQRQSGVQAVFPSLLSIAEQKTEEDSAKYAAGVAPVVDAGKQEAEDKNTDNPAADLAVYRAAVHPASTLAVVQ